MNSMMMMNEYRMQDDRLSQGFAASQAGPGELEELELTLAEMRQYVERYPEDETGVLHLQQFERKRAALAGELELLDAAILACSIGGAETAGSLQV
ncbi:hypothetical protein ACTHPH_07160 [Paenibacillus pasadenensis]|uniref:Uncharacterized protein n=1 Tax=Paenibacillus pasadenensis TaxID=217090 RepID=A0A2N5N9U1_9BACL|nr:hypothetical protein [Paenibacillus pasadenensis]PLT47127.1 hypothetical protein B8V81_1351 [Paenibacillus pasadenensis]